MSWILGLDIGERRIGVALAEDSTGVITTRETLEKQNGVAEKILIELIEELSIKIVVAGLPLTEAGGRTPQCEKIERFCRRLQRRANVEIRFVDEYLTSESSRDISTASSKGRAKGSLDAISASLILQDYLNHSMNKT